MRRSTPSNVCAVRRLVTRLRREDRVDAVDDPLLVLVLTSAQLVDDATAPSSDVAAYARAPCLATYGALLAQLAERVSSPTAGGDSALDEFLRSLRVPGPGAGDEPDGPGRL
jgi:hypothetical protein